MRRPLIAGNWKMYKTRAEAVQFVQALGQDLPEAAYREADGPQVMICAPFTLLAPVLEAAQSANIPLLVAAQTMESRDEGAYTGEISPRMLNDVGVQAVVLGHSERRQYYNETDATVAQKTIAALKANLLPIVCVGELLSEREAGETDAVVLKQVTTALADLTPQQVASLVIAYEPVWAIGTGKVCDATEANRVCGLIRQAVAQQFGQEAAQSLRVLYGGSMKPDNGAELLAQSDIDGGLVGGASLQAASFIQLVRQALDAVQKATVSA